METQKQEKKGYLDSPLYTSPYISDREEKEDYYENVEKPYFERQSDILFSQWEANQD